MVCMCYSVGGGYCDFNHEGWTRSSVSKGSNGPSGDHTNGSSEYDLWHDLLVTSFLDSFSAFFPLNSTLS